MIIPPACRRSNINTSVEVVNKFVRRWAVTSTGHRPHFSDCDARCYNWQLHGKRHRYCACRCHLCRSLLQSSYSAILAFLIVSGSVEKVFLHKEMTSQLVRGKVGVSVGSGSKKGRWWFVLRNHLPLCCSKYPPSDTYMIHVANRAYCKLLTPPGTSLTNCRKSTSSHNMCQIK